MTSSVGRAPAAVAPSGPDRSTDPETRDRPTPDQAPVAPGAGPRGHPGRRPVGLYLGVAATYLALGVGLWWHVWTTHPTATATCGCGDPALFTSFLEWPAYALAHGHNPFFTTALFHPGGLNMLANTSVEAVGLVLAPVTWVFGPVATLNVASTLSPVLSGLAAFWLIRRYVSWVPAAWLGGLFYGFSPFLLVSLVFGHLMTSLLVIPPLIAGALDELVLRQRRRPVAVGLVLGLLVVLEFFISTELIVIMAVSVALGLALVVGYGLVADRPGLRQRLPGAVAGGAVAVGVSAVLLAYPAWYAIWGPAHLSGPIWPNLDLGGVMVNSVVDGRTLQGSPLFTISGYSGPVMSSAYLGWGLLGVLAGGTLVFWRDRRLWFYGALGLLTGFVSLSVVEPFWVPWNLLQHLPEFDNVIEERFAVVVYLAVAVMLAVIVDRTRSAGLWDRLVARSAPERLDRGPAVAAPDPSGPGPAGRARLLGSVAAVAVAAVALVPVVRAVAPTVPFQTRTVGQPAWFVTTGSTLRARQVLLILPVPFSGVQSALAWQAVDGMPFDQVGGGGPQGTVIRAGTQRAGFSVLSGLAFSDPQFPLPDATPAHLAAVRRAMAAWRVTAVVDPDQRATVPFFIRGNDPQYSATFMTAALGTGPHFVHGSWVWQPVDLATRALEVPAGTVERCTGQAERRGQGPLAGPRCVLAAAAGASGG